MKQIAYELYDYQASLVNRTEQDLANPKTQNILIQSAPGSGKSVMIARLVKHHLALDKYHQVLFLVHRQVLIQQINETMQEELTDEQFKRFHAYSNKELAVKDFEKVHLMNAGTTMPRPTMLVTDECHHSLASTYIKTFKILEDIPKLGFTATPWRLSGKGFTDVFDKMEIGPSVLELIKKHHLAPFKFYVATLVTNEMVKKYSKKSRKNEDYKINAINKAINHIPDYEKLVIEEYQQQAKDKKTIIYVSDIQHAKSLAKAFVKSGIPAKELNSKSGKKERSATIDEFRTGETKVLINVDLFSEGFNVKDCEAVILLRPTKSLVLYLQQSMRCMRYVPGKQATIIDMTENYKSFGTPTEEHHWTLEDRKDNGNVRRLQFTCENCQQLNSLKSSVILADDENDRFNVNRYEYLGDEVDDKGNIIQQKEFSSDLISSYYRHFYSEDLNQRITNLGKLKESYSKKKQNISKDNLAILQTQFDEYNKKHSLFSVNEEKFQVVKCDDCDWYNFSLILTAEYQLKEKRDKQKQAQAERYEELKGTVIKNIKQLDPQDAKNYYDLLEYVYWRNNDIQNNPESKLSKYRQGWAYYRAIDSHFMSVPRDFSNNSQDAYTGIKRWSELSRDEKIRYNELLVNWQNQNHFDRKTCAISQSEFIEVTDEDKQIEQDVQNGKLKSNTPTHKPVFNIFDVLDQQDKQKEQSNNDAGSNGVSSLAFDNSKHVKKMQSLGNPFANSHSNNQTVKEPDEQTKISSADVSKILGYTNQIDEQNDEQKDKSTSSKSNTTTNNQTSSKPQSMFDYLKEQQTLRQQQAQEKENSSNTSANEKSAKDTTTDNNPSNDDVFAKKASNPSSPKKQEKYKPFGSKRAIPFPLDLGYETLEDLQSSDDDKQTVKTDNKAQISDDTFKEEHHKPVDTKTSVNGNNRNNTKETSSADDTLKKVLDLFGNDIVRIDTDD